MPVLERDPWRMQYFAGLDCPAELVIPTEDSDSWALYPAFRHVHDKMFVAASQGLAHAPHGVEPEHWPVFSKPVWNLRGMGAGSRPLAGVKDYRRHEQPGHMWMELLEGRHVSSDVALVNGLPCWWRHSEGMSLGGGMFDHWTIAAAAEPGIEAWCGTWAREHLAGYTGMANFETIGGRIIEVHLRFADQWPDLYGAGWLDALVRLYRDGLWRFDDADRRDGYSVVLFGGHGIAYRHPPAALVEELRAAFGVSSVQITFHADRPPRAHAMPPGGFRLAIVNCHDLEAGRQAREKLALAFWSTQSLLARRGRRAPVQS